MPKVTVFDMAGKSVGEMNLSDAVFGIEPNAAVMHAAVVNYLANQRQGTQSTLTRTEVQRRRQQALETEGHRSRKTGLHPRSPVDTRRYRSGPQAPRLQLLPSTRRSSVWPSSPLSPPRLPEGNMIVVDNIAVNELQDQDRCEYAQGPGR